MATKTDVQNLDVLTSSIMYKWWLEDTENRGKTVVDWDQADASFLDLKRELQAVEGRIARANEKLAELGFKHTVSMWPDPVRNK